MTCAIDLSGFRTPTLLLDETKMLRNIRRLADLAKVLDVGLRPHLKTAKSVEVAHRFWGGAPGPITVSTLAEAEAFHDAGYTDRWDCTGKAGPDRGTARQGLRPDGDPCHQAAKGWVLIIAGWMAMSRDRGTAAQEVDQGYGLVCDVRGVPIPGVIVTGAN